MRVSPVSLGELAAHLGCELEGDPAFRVAGVAALEDAGPDELSFVRSERYREALARSRAGALIAPPDFADPGRPVLRARDPGRVFARAVALLREPERPAPGIHPTAIVDPTAEVDPTASVGPRAVVGARARVGARSVLEPGVVLYPDVEIGRGCVLHAGVVVRERVRLGDRVLVQPAAVIGADGFGFVIDEQGRAERVPQVGGVVIEDDVEIGAHTSIARGTLGETRIRRGAKIDDLCLVAHNCDVGEDVILAGQCGLAGSATLGSRVILMGQVGVADHARVGEGVFAGAGTGISGRVPPGARIMGSPYHDLRLFRRIHASLRRLPELFRRVRALERRARLEGETGEEP